MKRIIALALALMLLLTLASCGKKDEAVETAPVITEAPEAPTEKVETPTEPAPTEPEWEPGIARAGYGELEYETYLRGVEVSVIGEWKDYFVIAGEEVDLLVEKQFVRTESEEAFEERAGYAKWNTEVYDNVYREGESIEKLTSNKKVTVVDGKGDWLFIQWDEDKSGYVDADMINKWPTKKKVVEGGSGAASGSYNDNGFIADQLAYVGPEMDALEEKALVLGDGARGALTVTVRDDEVKVTAVGEEVCDVYLDGFYAKLPRWLLTMEGDEEYEAWTGYARWNAIIFEEYQMRNELKILKTNDKVKVIDELEEAECYVVEFEAEEDGETVTKIGYMQLDKVMKYRYSAPKSQGGGGGTGAVSGGAYTPPTI